MPLCSFSNLHRAPARRSGALWSLAVALLLIMSGAVEVAAQDTGEPAPEALERMQKLNEQGFEAFGQGRFVEAAELFREAYEVVPDPNLRKNEAIAWFEAERCDRARTAAMDFLVANTTQESDQAEARAVVMACRLEQAKAALHDDDLSQADRLLDEIETMGPTGTLARRTVALRSSLDNRLAASAVIPGGDAAAGASPLDGAPAAGASWEPTLPPLRWVLMGAGGIALVGTIIYHVAVLHAQDEFLELSEGGSGADRARFDELAGQIDQATWLLPTMYAISGASVGVGLWLELDRGAPAAGPEGAAGGERGAAVRAQVTLRF